MPIVLAISTTDKQRLEASGSDVTLTYNNRPVAVIRKPEYFEHRKEERYVLVAHLIACLMPI